MQDDGWWAERQLAAGEGHVRGLIADLNNKTDDHARRIREAVNGTMRGMPASNVADQIRYLQLHLDFLLKRVNALAAERGRIAPPRATATIDAPSPPRYKAPPSPSRAR